MNDFDENEVSPRKKPRMTTPIHHSRLAQVSLQARPGENCDKAAAARSGQPPAHMSGIQRTSVRSRHPIDRTQPQ